MNNPLEMWSGIGDIFVIVVCVLFGMLLLIGLIMWLYWIGKVLAWCYRRCLAKWRNWRNPPRRYTPPNPWEHQPVAPPAPPPVIPPRPQLPPRRGAPPKYVKQEVDFAEREELGPRSPVRLLYSAAFERLTDGQLEEIRVRAPDVIQRLHRAAFLLHMHRTAEAENLLFVLRGYVRRHFGEGRFWLEAVIISDIAALCHYANKPEDADHHFEVALRVATPWFDKYPWLRHMVTRRRLIKA